MAKKSQATKAVLASLLATSAIVPAIAVNAEVGGETTRTTEAVTTSAAAAKTINFTNDAPATLQKFIPTSGKLVERNGQQFIQLDLDAAFLAMINTVKVGDTSAMFEANGTKTIYIPVTADYKPVEVVLNVTVPFGPNPAPTDYKVTLTPDAKSIKEVTAETKPAEKPAAEEKIFAVGKTFESVADGTYDVKWDAYKGNVGNYGAIKNQMSPDAKLVVKEGKYALQLSTLPTSNAIITDIKVGDKSVPVVAGTTKEGEARTFEFELKSIGELHEAEIFIDAGGRAMNHVFGFAIETADLELPKAETKPETKPTAPVTSKQPVTVYKFGTQELSIMHNKYLDDEVTVTATEGGYDVDVTFPEGQHLLGFDVEGATVALKSEEKVGNNTVKIYTLSVKDLTKVYTATADLKVMLNGAVLYEEAHKLQLKFAAAPVAVPFKDIDKNGNKDAIINLYNKGIFKAADKFNPANNLTRSQFALMLNRALNLDVAAKQKFSDLPKDAEAVKAINALNGYGIINGTSTTTFSPGKDITRKQAALMIYRLLEKQGYQATGATANFSDMPKDAEAAKAIAELNKLGVISGFEGKFNPENKLTRSQMAKILNNTLTAVEGLKK